MHRFALAALLALVGCEPLGSRSPSSTPDDGPPSLLSRLPSEQVTPWSARGFLSATGEDLEAFYRRALQAKLRTQTEEVLSWWLGEIRGKERVYCCYDPSGLPGLATPASGASEGSVAVVVGTTLYSVFDDSTSDARTPQQVQRLDLRDRTTLTPLPPIVLEGGAVGLLASGQRLLVFSQFQDPTLISPLPKGIYATSPSPPQGCPQDIDPTITSLRLYDLTTLEPVLVREVQVSGAMGAARLVGSTVQLLTQSYPPALPWSPKQLLPEQYRELGWLELQALSPEEKDTFRQQIRAKEQAMEDALEGCALRRAIPWYEEIGVSPSRRRLTGSLHRASIFDGATATTVLSLDLDAPRDQPIAPPVTLLADRGRVTTTERSFYLSINRDMTSGECVPDRDPRTSFLSLYRFAVDEPRARLDAWTYVPGNLMGPSALAEDHDLVRLVTSTPDTPRAHHLTTLDTTHRLAPLQVQALPASEQAIEGVLLTPERAYVSTRDRSLSVLNLTPSGGAPVTTPIDGRVSQWLPLSRGGFLGIDPDHGTILTFDAAGLPQASLRPSVVAPEDTVDLMGPATLAPQGHGYLVVPMRVMHPPDQGPAHWVCGLYEVSPDGQVVERAMLSQPPSSWDALPCTARADAERLYVLDQSRVLAFSLDDLTQPRGEFSTPW